MRARLILAYRVRVKTAAGSRGAELGGWVLNDESFVSPRLFVEAGSSQAETLSLVEVSGLVKWFDAGKGYGFVTPDQGGADVLLHVTTLRKDGFELALEGARVVGEAVRRAKGLQFLKVISIDLSSAAHPEIRPSAARFASAPSGGFEVAIVKWFNRTRGFGFLTRGDGTGDIFIHMETLRHYGIGEVQPGESLLVRFGDGPKGLIAVEVRALNAAASRSH
ncbi:cold shock protein (beta-ribbon, CspA family) [Methylocapsa palsarum]|uniref:Cold shock protein (Beta-ribbon, CspA family) n=1 Tax=Methylocapsa palsarum TaxID=1612308 RepID=A0A1I3YCX0_9HYPH|nr:cold shock protein (beta-ribbon, CspA family) [Methylocapsa palsarum]